MSGMTRHRALSAAADARVIPPQWLIFGQPCPSKDKEKGPPVTGDPSLKRCGRAAGLFDYW
jgi:hypothetical protein